VRLLIVEAVVMRHFVCSFALLVATTRLFAADPDAVNKAIDKGVDYLRSQQTEQGTWPHHEIGATCLAGLALLESGVKPDDAAIKKAAAVVREASPTIATTYSAALAIMFLDRLGDARDVPLIQSLGVRLLGGQGGQGGWSYACFANPDSEVKRLTDLVRKFDKESPGSGKESPGSGDSKRSSTLSKELQALLALVQAQKRAQKANNGDHSNTQFAVFGLWVARRYGVPVEAALVESYNRFAGAQNADGGWGYILNGLNGCSTSSAQMTCAGLFVLAAGYGSVQESRDEANVKKLPPFEKEKVVQRGLAALGACIDHPVKKGERAAQLGPGNGRAYYFFYSLERTALVFGLDTVGGKDWYGWGAEILVANQQPDGSWHGDFSKGGVDTSFALLFLRRSNLARDLTQSVKGKVTDPGESILKAGGVGGEALLGKGIKPAIDSTDISRDLKPVSDPAAVRLADRLAAGTDSAADLEKLKVGKGAAYTVALATVIPKLDGDAKKPAREALAERLSALTESTIRQWLKSDNAEIRRAAVLALAMKDDGGSGSGRMDRLSDIVDRLDDTDPLVVRAALAALKSLTKEKFGPPPNATEAERAHAIEEWKDWFNRSR
jgi:hypothetical protein